MLALAAVLVILGLLVADLSIYLGARARAQVAADAAALAAAPVTFRPFGAAGSAVEEARRFAAVNGGMLLECRCALDPSWRSRRVAVLVSVSADLLMLGGVDATAWSGADFDPTRLVSQRPERLQGRGTRSVRPELVDRNTKRGAGP